MNVKRTGKIDFARLACDIVNDGRPDFYNSPAKRVVDIEESKRMGWKQYYDGHTACIQGHVAARYVSNPALCVDCKRIGDGKPPIYPAAHFTDDLTAAPIYVDPVANGEFKWTDEIRRQFINSWINTTSVPRALAIIKAQPTHLIDLLERDNEFKAEYEAAERKVSLVQQWSLEGEAADGSDRVRLAMGQNKFTSFGAKTGMAGRPAVNSEEARAELTQLLSSVRKSIDQRERLAAVARANGALARAAQGSTASAGDDVEEPTVLGPTHDDSDLVS